MVMPDRELAAILGSMKRLESLEVTCSEFDNLSFQAIRRHFGAIQELSVGNSKGVTAAMVSEILQSCPELRVFIDTVDVREMGLLSPQNPPWICKQLRRHHLAFVFDPPTDATPPMTLTTSFAEMVETGSEDEDEDEDMDQWAWLVYEKLSRLALLKCLDIGYVSSNCNYLQLRLQLSEGRPVVDIETDAGTLFHVYETKIWMRTM